MTRIETRPQMRRRLSILIALCLAWGASITYSVLAPSPAAADEQPAWWDYERPAAYEPVRSAITVPTRDGTTLGCHLYRPGRNGAAAPGRFPVVVWEFTPYTATHQPATEGLLSDLEEILPVAEELLTGSPAAYARWVTEPAEYLASRGYVVAVCDVRGTGGPAATSLPGSGQSRHRTTTTWSSGWLDSPGRPAALAKGDPAMHR